MDLKPFLPDSIFSFSRNLWVYGRMDSSFPSFSLLMSTFSLLIAGSFLEVFLLSLDLKSYRLHFRYTERSTTFQILRFEITASVSYLVSCISGANSLLLYVVTRFFTDGCFQAHRQVVLGSSLPFALSMKFETLSIDLGCFPLNVQYLSTAVGLRFSLFKLIHSLHLIGTL